MKTKIKRHSRSVLSVVLAVCMIVSCMTVGLITTDAAKVDGESVGVDGGTMWYSLNGATDWGWVNLSSGDGSITLDSAQSLEFNFSYNGTQYKKESSGNAPTGRQASNYSFYAKKTAGGGNTLENFYIASLAAGTYNIHIVGNDGNQITFNFYKAVTEYAITTISNGNGSLTSSLATAAKDAEVTLTAAPDRGYILDTVTIAGDDGTSVASTVSGNNVSFTMPAQNVTATASFTTNPNSYTITANQVTVGEGTLKIALKNGTKAVGAEIADTTAAKTLTAYSGETLTISAVHGSGYKLKKLTVTDGNGTNEYTDQSTVTINPVASDVTATAEFEEGETLPNDYTAEKGSTITDGEANGSIFANIKATFYDYYTDGEAVGGWYKGINAQTEAWIGGISERNPYKILNSALSKYASENSVKYPLYFGSFYVTSYQDPNYFHSAANDPFYGDRINDSNALGGTTGNNSWALPGLAGSSLSGGNIYYTNGTNGGIGAPMELFDKTWLSGDSSADANLIKLVYSSSCNWSDSNANVYVIFRNTWPNEYVVAMTWDSANSCYTATIPAGWENSDRVCFVRMNSNTTLNTGEFTTIAAAQQNWDKINGSECWDKILDMTRTGNVFTLTDWRVGTWSYNGPLASFMNTSFPVYKRTQEGATYYEFDSSSDHYDTVYFDSLNFDNPSGSTPKIQFSTDDENKSIMNGFNDGVGFFPFDRYDVNKVSGKSDRYGKDLATGMKLEFKFTLGKNASGQEGYILKDGATGNNDSDYVAQKFNFSGDDDLWVYVDDNLILDLGGDHSKTTGTIDFAQKKVTGVSADTTLTAAQSITRNGSFTLADKRVHTMTIYYMERGMHESNLKFGFSMSPLATDFSTEKEVDTSNLNPGIGMYDASTNTNGFIDTFEFTNTSYDNDGTTVNDHSKSKAYKYFKWDSAQNKYVEQLGSYSSNDTGKFSLTSDPTKQYADFDNKLKVNDVLQVTETSQKGYHYNTTYEILDEEYLVDDAPDLIKAGSGTDTGKFIFKTIMPNADVNTDVTNIRVKFLNELKTQTVYVKKEIKNDYLTADSFEIQVGLKMVNGGTQTILNTAGLKYKSDDDNYVTEKSLGSNGECSIRQDETLRFEGIPEGATVTITETPKTGYTIDSIAHSETNNTLSYTSGAYTASVVLDKIDTITITNEKLFDLNIKKELTGDSAPAGTYFPIMVSVKQPGGTLTQQITASNYASFTYDVGTMPTAAGTNNANKVYFNTSTGYFMLKPGEDFTIKSFKKDTEFTVAEKTDVVANCNYGSTVVDGSDSTDYTDNTNHLSGKQGIKIGAKDITVTVNNAMMLKKTLTITKKLTSGTDASTAFTVAVTLDGTAYQGAWKLNDTAQPDTTTGVFTVHQDDEITIENILVNSTIVVSETNIPFNYTLSKITVGLDPETEDVKNTSTNGYTFDIADDTNVAIWNAPITYHYSITYAYDSYRDLHKTQKYKVTGNFDNTTAKVADYLTVSNTVYDDDTKSNVTAYWFKDDNARKNFINILGPYENNYRQKLYWNTDMKSETNSEGVSIVYSSSDHTYTIDVNVIASSQKFVDLTFKLPYNHDVRSTAYAATETDGKVLYNNALPDETISNLDYGTWFASNGVKYGESGKPQFVSAPLVIYDGTQAKGFKYWTVKTVATDLAPSVEYTKCYYHEFNLSIYQDSIVEPHYENITAEEAANYSHNAHEEAIKEGNANGAVVTFIENSRNQYNMRNENIKQSSRKQQGDRIYTDFLLSYASESDLKFQDYPNGTYTAGLAIQKVALLDDDRVNGKITDSAHYATKYGANLGEMKYNGVAFDKTTLESFIKGNADYNDAIGLERSEFDANKLDNKNRIQYYYSYSVRSHTDLTDNGNKDYVYRAFAYMKDNSGNVTMVSQPLYFTFYDMASIANAQIGYNADFPSTPTP